MNPIRPAVVIVGSFASGFSVVGPFESGAEAVEWCDKHMDSDDVWEVMDIMPQDCYDAEYVL